MAEAFADNEVGMNSLAATYHSIAPRWLTTEVSPEEVVGVSARVAVSRATSSPGGFMSAGETHGYDLAKQACHATIDAAKAFAWERDANDVAGGFRANLACQCGLLRDTIGPLPFRPATLPPPVRTWDDGTIVKLAEAAYQERALPSGELDRERLAVLADALEEVDADALLLNHLWGRGRTSVDVSF